MNFYGQTDIGCVRDTNQDFFCITSLSTASCKYTLCVVCDGMGGANGGSTASRTACTVFVDCVKDGLDKAHRQNTLDGLLRYAQEQANTAVFTLAESDKTLEGMGTTLCAVLTDANRFYAVSVGDSRLYIFSGGQIRQISHDHSYVQTLVDSGAITKEESKTHPNKNIITRAVGTAEDVEGDSFCLETPLDGFLLCSDGLTNFVSDSELNELFWQYNTPEEMVRVCVDKAKAAGGTDNITVIAGK